MKKKTHDYIIKITILGIMSALAAVCAGTFPMGLTVRIGQIIKLSPVFLVVALAGSMYGWWGGALVAFIGDFLQAINAGLGLSPFILAVNVLNGICFGIFLHNKCNIKRIFVSVLLNQFVGGLILITLILNFQYGVPIIPAVYWRIMQSFIMSAISIFSLWLILIKLKLPEKLKESR